MDAALPLIRAAEDGVSRAVIKKSLQILAIEEAQTNEKGARRTPKCTLRFSRGRVPKTLIAGLALQRAALRQDLDDKAMGHEGHTR